MTKKRMVWVLGAPANGKTTFAKQGLELGRERGLDIKWICDKDFLLEIICQKSVVSEKYNYDEGGCLILKDEYREEILERLLKELAIEIADSRNQFMIVELTHPNLVAVLNDYFEKLIGEGSELVYIASKSEMRDLRNSQRIKREQVPKVYLNMFATDYRAEYEHVKELFPSSTLIENVEGFEEFVGMARNWWENCF